MWVRVPLWRNGNTRQVEGLCPRGRAGSSPVRGTNARLLFASVRGPYQALFFLQYGGPTKQHGEVGLWLEGNQLLCGRIAEDRAEDQPYDVS
jgi:hypothetical protein